MNKTNRGLAPFGFHWQGKKLIVDAAEAAIRRRAVDLFLKLKSMGAVAHRLNVAGDATRRGGKWTDVQVTRILECSSAIGIYEINKTVKDASGRRRKTFKGERITVECDSIVTRQQWETVKALIQRIRAKRAGDGHKNTAMRLAWSGAGPKRSVPSATGKLGCLKFSTLVAPGDLEAIFVNDFADVIQSHPSLSGALELSTECLEWMEEVARLESEIEDAVKERAGVEHTFTEAAISKARFEELHAPVIERTFELKTKLDGLQKNLAKAAGQRARNLVTSWQALWPSWSESRRRRIILTFLCAYLVRSDEVEIDYCPSGPNDSKATTDTRQISSPTRQQQAVSSPVYLRLPKPGKKCTTTGLRRATLNELILPNERNGFKPPVASKSLRKKGSTRGVRLIVLESLVSHLAASD